MHGAVSMTIHRWHWGKIVILWAWGGLAVALLMNTFLSKKAEEDPIVSSLSCVGSVLILGVPHNCHLDMAEWKGRSPN